jgi:ankyrin repeat protein
VLLEHVANLGAEDDGGKTTFQVVSEYVNARNAKGRTPLYLTSRGPSMGGPNIALSLSSVARLLLDHGADVNAGNDHSTPLHVAVQKGRVEVVHVLLEYGANVAAEDEDGKTASQFASEMGHEEITKLLLEHRARE